MLDVVAMRALYAAFRRARLAGHEMSVPEVLRELLDDDQSDAVALLTHIGMDPVALCHAADARPVAVTLAALTADAAQVTREAGDQHTRSDHVLIALADRLPDVDVTAMRSALAARAAAPPVVPEPANPVMRLPGYGGLVAWCGLVSAGAVLVLAAMYALTPPEVRAPLLAFGLVGAVAMTAAQLVPVATAGSTRRLLQRLLGGHMSRPISVPWIDAALHGAGLYSVELHLRGPGPSGLVMFGSSHMAWLAIDEALLPLRGSSFRIANTVVMAARRTPSRIRAATNVAQLLALAWPLAYVWRLESGGPVPFAVAPVAVGVIAGALLYVGTRWWDEFATIRTTAAWVGAPATDAWFDLVRLNTGPRQRRIRRWRDLRQRLTRLPARLRQRAWAGELGLRRLHRQWHDTTRRLGIAKPDPAIRDCPGNTLITRWLGPYRPEVPVTELRRRLAVIDAAPAGPGRDEVRLAAWFRESVTPGGGPRDAELAEQVLNDLGTPREIVAEVVRLVRLAPGPVADGDLNAAVLTGALAPGPADYVPARWPVSS